MGQVSTRTDFEWVTTDEPHATRRKQILAKYPQIKKLMKPNRMLAVQSFYVVVLQIFMCYMLQEASWPTIIILGYCVGGVANHNLFLAVHELSHNNAFGQTHPVRNRLMAFVANLPVGVPMCVTFKKYHMEHHRYLSDPAIDTDLPTAFEAKLFRSTFGKIIWLTLNPFLYSLRPLVVAPKPVTLWEVANLAVQVVFDAVIWYCFGPRMLFYLLFSSLISMGVHPVAGHFISEHYTFHKGQYTCSYYGPLNWVTFNVGYHVEHHDFPSIPGWSLPEVKRIAPEFYDNLPCHTSWVKVIWQFITCKDLDLYARVKHLNPIDLNGANKSTVKNRSQKK